MPATSEGGLFAAEVMLVSLLVLIILAGILARILRLPYTTLLVLTGLGLAALRGGSDTPILLTPEIVLLLFLPPLVFEAAFHLDFDHLKRDLAPILTLALAGVVLTMAVAGALLVAGLGWSWPLALLFGALVAATDPVSVVAVFRELGAPRRLSMLVEGESLFNDGTGIVLYRLVLGVVVGGAVHPLAGGLEFIRLVAGGLLLGALVGFVAARVLALVDDYLMEVALTVAVAWGTYLLAENAWIGVSGVIAVVVAGLVLGSYGGRVSFSPTTRIALTHVWEFIAFVANSFIFLLIGLQVNLSSLAADLPVMAWAIGATLAARAVMVYGLSLPLARVAPAIPLRWQHLLFWGGLRGGLTLALALGLPASVPQRDTLIVAAFGVVLFTLVAQGLSIRPLLGALRISAVPLGTQQHAETRGRLQAVRAAQRHLERLRERGLLSEQAHQALTSEYAVREQQLQANLYALYQEHPDLTEQELKQARREGLRAERSELLDLRQEGAISDRVYRDLAADVDAGLVGDKE